MVDIDYEVVSDDPDIEVRVFPQGFDADANKYIPMLTLSGEGAAGTRVGPGRHRMTWNMQADALQLVSTNFVVNMQAFSGHPKYMVIDLSPGADASIDNYAQGYPVTYLADVPEGGWTDEFKTTKLVLRLIKPRTFMMGSRAGELGSDWASYCNGEDLHQVILTKPFYMGVFEVTQKQWALVMGTAPSTYRGDSRPVEGVSYNAIRGTGLGTNWPATNSVAAASFLYRVRTATGLLFDLPTDAQWEYACRAGTATALNSGKDLQGTQTCANMAEVGRYYGNSGDGKGGYSEHTVVGCYLPNAWGLYDMHGNVAEWCLDWWQQHLGTSAVTDPVGPASGTYRLVRGGCWHSEYSYATYAAACRSAYRSYNYRHTDYREWNTAPGNAQKTWGFRLACLPAE